MGRKLHTWVYLQHRLWSCCTFGMLEQKRNDFNIFTKVFQTFFINKRWKQLQQNMRVNIYIELNHQNMSGDTMKTKNETLLYYYPEKNLPFDSINPDKSSSDLIFSHLHKAKGMWLIHWTWMRREILHNLLNYMELIFTNHVT